MDTTSQALLGDAPGPRLTTAATLVGDPVVSPAGEVLGQVNGIMLDVPRGRIAYAVMTQDRMPGLSERLFAIPWHALVLDTDRGCFVLDASESHFDKAPGFDRDHWPHQADEQWHRDLHALYRAPLYWE